MDNNMKNQFRRIKNKSGFLNKKQKKDCIDKKGLRHFLGNYSATFPDCSLNFSKIKIKYKDTLFEYEYRGTSDYFDKTVGSRAVRYLWGIRVRHFGNNIFYRENCMSKKRSITSIQYRGVEPGVEAEYEIHKKYIKNMIVVSGILDVYEFMYLINVSNLTPYLSNDKKTISFYKKNKTVLSFLQSYVIDSVGKIDFNVFYEIKMISKNSLCLIIKPDRDWIESIDRVKPITIVFPMVLEKNKRIL